MSPSARLAAAGLGALASVGLLTLTDVAAAAPGGARAGAAASGTVVGTGGAGLTLRTTASSTGGALAVMPEGAAVPVACYVFGQSVTSPLRTTDVWDRITYAGKTGYGSDAYVDLHGAGAQVPACVSTPTPTPSPTPPPTGGGGVTKGVDVSGYTNGTLDFGRMRTAGRRFAIFSVSEGLTDHTAYGDAADPLGHADYWQRRQAATAAGLYTSAYHFALPDQSAYGTQASLFLRASRYTQIPAANSLPPVLDFERGDYFGYPTCYDATPTALVSWLTGWLRQVRTATGQTPIVYTDRPTIERCLSGASNLGQLAAYPLWISSRLANPCDTPVTPGSTAPWTTWTFWQYVVDGAACDGNPGYEQTYQPNRADQDYFNGSAAQLDALARRTG